MPKCAEGNTAIRSVSGSSYAGTFSAQSEEGGSAQVAETDQSAFASQTAVSNGGSEFESTSSLAPPFFPQIQRIDP